MKVEYKNIIGTVTKDITLCRHCCFYHLTNCIPVDIHECRRDIFKRSKTQIFNL